MLLDNDADCCYDDNDNNDDDDAAVADNKVRRLRCRRLGQLSDVGFYVMMMVACAQ